MSKNISPYVSGFQINVRFKLTPVALAYFVTFMYRVSYKFVFHVLLKSLDKIKFRVIYLQHNVNSFKY